MIQIYTEQALDALRKKLILMLICGAGCLACLVILEVWLATGQLTIIRAIMGFALFVSVLVFGYIMLQRHILPCYRILKLGCLVSTQKHKTISGSYIGYDSSHDCINNVFFKRMLLDTGASIRDESISSVFLVPAYIEGPEYAPGTQVTVCTVSNVMVSCTSPRTGWSPEFKFTRIRNRSSAALISSVFLSGLLLWASLYAVSNRMSPHAELNFAICAETYAKLDIEEIETVLANHGIDAVNLSYSNTSNGEAAAQYLATYGALEADILLLDAWSFGGAFANEGYRFTDQDIIALEQAAGSPLRFVCDSEGHITGIVLYDCSDMEYSKMFPNLQNWLQLNDDADYIVVINTQSEHLEDEAAVAAVRQLLSLLSCA